MDPFSLTVGIAGLLPLVAEVIKSARAYGHAVLTARETIASFISELERLKFSLDNLDEFLKLQDTDDVKFQHTSVLASCSTACDAKLRTLCEKLKLKADKKGKSRVLLWPFSEKEHRETLQELRNFTIWMNFALSIDGCRLLSRTSEDVLKVLGAQLEQFQAIRSMGANLDRLSTAVDGQRQMLESSRDERARKEILIWISTTEYGQKHQALRETRAQKAGEWVLQSPEYIKWRDGRGMDTVLWGRGIQGSGKTNLVSIIIDDLLSFKQASAVAYFYFDHQNQSAQSPAKLFSCILRQILDQQPRIPAAVFDVYETSSAKGGLPEFECEKLIDQVTKQLNRVYLVIDALDECAPEHRASIMQTLARLTSIRILITSRPHVQEISNTFPDRIRLKIKAREEDITLYLCNELKKNGFDDVEHDEFANELVQKLTRGADGMFLLPVLQLRTILKEPTLGEMEESLNSISQNLTEAFKETIGRIRTLPPSRSRMGMDVLMYLTHAGTTLDINVLRDLLAVHPTRRRVNAKYRPTEKVILDCCQGLVTIDAVTHQVGTCHYSVTEYLRQNDDQLFPRAEAIFATKCLQYIMLDDFSTGPWADEESLVSHTKPVTYPFLDYAVRHWGRHARLAEDDREVQTVLADFFSSVRAMATANQVRQYNMGYREEYWAAKECLSFTALHHASRNGLTATVKMLLRTKKYDVNVTTTEGATPVIHAAANGHREIVTLLMECGADPYLRNWYGNALHCAIESGQTQTVRDLVLRWGMDVRSGKDKTGEDCLRRALVRDSVETFKAVVDLGAKVEKEGDAGSKILVQACLAGARQIVDLILTSGWADANTRLANGETILHCAARDSNLAIVERLIAAGADIGAVDSEGVSAWETIRESYHSLSTRVVSSVDEYLKARSIRAMEEEIALRENQKRHSMTTTMK